MTNDNAVPNKENAKKKNNVLLKIILFLILFLLIASAGFYFYYKDTQTKRAKYNSSIQQIENLQKEKDRCSQVLGQGSGEFEDYEYCSQLLRVFPK
ncbi:MAG: hypothetical protein PHI59_09015 [Candidatus Omnitrophica bacterium]|nr:hypothetical protein [Candidatus Omnitrophota bacterium]